MKLLLIFLMILAYDQINGQDSQESDDSIKYDLYTKSSCDNKIDKVIGYKLYSLSRNSNDSYSPDSNGSCYLPRTGQYLIVVYSNNAVIKERQISINRNDQIDTILIPPIYLSFKTKEVGSASYFYAQCGIICNGYHKSLREDGEIWQEGEFKNGKIIELKIYKPGGKMDVSIKHKPFLSSIKFYNNDKLWIKYKRIMFFSTYKVFNERPNKDSYHITLGNKMKDFLYY